MGTPGGDLGEFIRLMQIVELSRGAHAAELSEEVVLTHFQQLLEDMQEAGRSHFFMGTDAAALKRWGDAAAV